jgi:hypothetical protein
VAKTARPSRPSPVQTRMRGDGIPTTDPLTVVRSVLVVARRAGFRFKRAYPLAAEAALGYMPEAEAQAWWDALNATRYAWADAYQGRHRSAFAELNPEHRD